MRTFDIPAIRKPLVLFGTGDLAQIAYEYFNTDSNYYVVGFTVDTDHLTETSLLGLPIVPFDMIESYFPPETHDIHVCVVYRNMNRNREATCRRVKARRYNLASYISSRAFVSPSAKIGEHAFVFEDNTIQPYVTIGDNCILWSGNHVGHHSKIGDNVFVSSHVVISGHCDIGDNCFLGVNSTLANNTIIGKESWVTHGAIISNNVPPHSMIKSVPSAMIELNEEALARALDRAAEKAKP